MRQPLGLFLAWCSCCNHNANGFLSTQRKQGVIVTNLWCQNNTRGSDQLTLDLNCVNPAQPPAIVSRKRWIRQYITLGASMVSVVAMKSDAVNAAPESGEPKDTLWLTGKDPVVPGKAPRDKSDVKGTRKDPNFLRSIADCKNQCENSTGSDGLARSKEDCLSECQDICCQTYQQCTFGIVPRI